MAEFAMVVDGAGCVALVGVLWEMGLRGVLLPVVVTDTGGTRLPGVGWRREGRSGSGGIMPSFWSVRSCRSRRRICRSSYIEVSGLFPITWNVSRTRARVKIRSEGHEMDLGSDQGTEKQNSSH